MTSIYVDGPVETAPPIETKKVCPFRFARSVRDGSVFVREEFQAPTHDELLKLVEAFSKPLTPRSPNDYFQSR